MNNELMEAMKKGKMDLVHSILNSDENIDINQRDEGGYTLLMHASLWNDPEIMDELLSKKDIDLNLTNNEGQTALTLAIDDSDADAVNKLLDKGARTDIIDEYGFTPLHYASMHSNFEIFNKIMDSCAAYINTQDNRGETPLMEAVLSFDEDIYETLLNNKDIDINLADREGETALMKAIEYENMDLVDRLMDEKNIDINKQDENGFTALRYAINCIRYPEIAEKLLERNDIDVNLQDKEGKTDLMYAMERDQYEIVNALLEKENINVKLKDTKGNSLLSYATDYGYYGVIIKLIKKDAIDLDDEENRRLLYEFINDGREKQPYFEIDEISNENKDYVIQMINDSVRDFDQKINTPVYGEDTPMRDFIGSCEVFMKPILENNEEKELNDIITKFDNGALNNNKRETEEAVNDLAKLCVKSKNVYYMIQPIVDKNIIYRDTETSLTDILRENGFEQKDFMSKVDFEQIINKDSGISDIINTEGNGEVEKSTINKMFELMYKTTDNENFYNLSKNVDINNAYLAYQESDRTFEDKCKFSDAFINSTTREEREAFARSFIDPANRIKVDRSYEEYPNDKGLDVNKDHREYYLPELFRNGIGREFTRILIIDTENKISDELDKEIGIILENDKNVEKDSIDNSVISNEVTEEKRSNEDDRVLSDNLGKMIAELTAQKENAL